MAKGHDLGLLQQGLLLLPSLEVIEVIGMSNASRYGRGYWCVL